MRMNAGQAKRSRATGSGFSLVELLAVIGIIMVLLAMAAVGLNAARKAARDVAAQQFLNSISMALSAYDRDADGLPPSYWGDPDDGRPVVDGPGFGLDAATLEDWSGAEILAAALVGPRSDDGQTGPGFTERGRSYGPYLDVDSESNLVYVADDGEPAFGEYTVRSTGDDYTLTGNHAPPDGRWALTTRQGQWPVLYYRAEVTGATRTFESGDEAVWVWGENGRFNTADNATILDGAGLAEDAPVAIWEEGAEHSTESHNFATRLRSADFLLVTPGEDNIFGNPGGGYEPDDSTHTGP